MGSTDRVYKYEAVPGFFMQDDLATVAKTFDYTKHDFGLIAQKYSPSVADAKTTQWQRFSAHVTHLIATAPEGTTYKLVYLARHGQGYHNLAESFYGTAAWDAVWAAKEGNGTVTWADSELTDLGERQAQDAGAFFKSQIRDQGMPIPDAWVVSPLMRCLHTCDLSWSGLGLKQFVPTIREKVREVMGVHTCDRRSSKSVFSKRYPVWPIEPGFVEEDVYWKADHRETFAEHDARTQELLDQLFTGDEKNATVISVTSHSGTIRSFLRVLGHRLFDLQTGGYIPVLVKATRVD